MTTKKKDKPPITNGIVFIDGKAYMQCGDNLVLIKYVPIKGQED